MRWFKPFIAILFAEFCLLSFGCTPVAEKILSQQYADTAAQQQLGRYLFYDRRLSINFTRACATCHNPDFAFTDGYKRSAGAFADLHQRNSSPLFNLQYYKYLTAADSSLHLVVEQMNQPLKNNHPVEMGVTGHEEEIIARLKKDKLYQQLFAKAFPGGSDPLVWGNIKEAISRFVTTIQSGNSPYDKYIIGDSNAISPVQKKGLQLFFSHRFNCGSCHGGFNFSTPSVTGANGDTMHFFNIGLYNMDKAGGYPGYDQGLYQYTHNKKDMGKYRVPGLRNLAFTGPYFHDGSAASITDAVTVFMNGGRNVLTGIYKGDGTKNPYRFSALRRIDATEEEKTALVNFLYALSDSALIQNNAFRNPFTNDETKKN